MSTKSKTKPSAEKAKKEASSSQSLLKKTGKNVMATLNSVKSSLVGGKGASKGSKADAQKKSVSNGIYVKGISHKQSLDEIQSIFQAAGEIKECRRRSDKYALIWFVDQSSAKKAIDMFHHKPIESFPSTSDAAFATLSTNERARKSNPRLYASGKRKPSTLSKYIVQHAQVAPPADRATYCKSIFVSGLPNAQMLPNALLRAAFAKYGKVVKMARYSPTSFTFVYYADVASAVKAQKDIDGKGLASLLKNVEMPKPAKPSQKGDGKKLTKKEAKPFAMPKAEYKLQVQLSVRTKERDETREAAARKHSKHKEDYKKWVRGTGF
ncbi:RNA binding protein [Perkinsela sp. CCAP 1560/4]|nr:RNA binding protein [Perkinsela sp. CCAP 1560/4]|eukprot:KNH04244.1 RNA binding protein [Perkinsela sp. CCAP 1560/4]